VQKKMMTKGGYVEDMTRFMALCVNERKLQINNLKNPQLHLSVTTQFNEHTIFAPFYALIKNQTFLCFCGSSEFPFIKTISVNFTHSNM
jgi:hypothetical protein